MNLNEPRTSTVGELNVVMDKENHFESGVAIEVAKPIEEIRFRCRCLRADAILARNLLTLPLFIGLDACCGLNGNMLKQCNTIVRVEESRRAYC
jgi:hypothetical protein